MSPNKAIVHKTLGWRAYPKRKEKILKIKFCRVLCNMAEGRHDEPLSLMSMRDMDITKLHCCDS